MQHSFEPDMPQEAATAAPLSNAVSNRRSHTPTLASNPPIRSMLLGAYVLGAAAAAVIAGTQAVSNPGVARAWAQQGLLTSSLITFGHIVMTSRFSLGTRGFAWVLSTAPFPVVFAYVLVSLPSAREAGGTARPAVRGGKVAVV